MGNLTANAPTGTPPVPSRTFSYDAENRQVQAVINLATSNYTYDVDGRRVTRSTPGVDSEGNPITVVTTFVYDAEGQLAQEYSNGAATDSGTSYLTADHLGSTRLITDGSAGVKKRFDYLPFGEELLAGTGGRTTAMGYNTALSASLPDVQSTKFTSKERDAETGLDWFGTRYMSSAQGRFTSPDKPFADQDEGDPQSWNLYSYVRNNPLKFVDEIGREIVYASDRLQAISNQRRQESPSYNANLQGFDGPGSPRLVIQYGPTANDPDGSPTNGVFSSKISPSGQNCSSATDCTTIPARLNSGTITVNDSLQKNDDQASETLAHEAVHANEARTDPQGYSNQPIRDAKGRIIPHDNRPVEQRAIAGAKQSDQERKDYARQQREEQKRQKQEQKKQEGERKKKDPAVN